MTIPANIYLVGPMGAGKSTIGRRLAIALDKPFRDSDKAIELRTGVDIPTIFEFEQETGFRQRECSVIDELTQEQGIVLATGGGAILAEENRRHLKERGFVVYLSASLKHLLRRTHNDRNRPLLQTQDPSARLQELLAQRDPLYREVADLIINTDHSNVRLVAQSILKALRSPTNG